MLSVNWLTSRYGLGPLPWVAGEIIPVSKLTALISSRLLGRFTRRLGRAVSRSSRVVGLVCRAGGHRRPPLLPLLGDSDLSTVACATRLSRLAPRRTAWEWCRCNPTEKVGGMHRT
eukprot:6187475-Pleurochrysis_carterae.AAC.2